MAYSSQKDSKITVYVFQSKGAKEKVVTRIMISRCEVDLKKIRSEYKAQFGKSLYQTISVSYMLITFICTMHVSYAF